MFTRGAKLGVPAHHECFFPCCTVDLFITNVCFVLYCGPRILQFFYPLCVHSCIVFPRFKRAEHVASAWTLKALRSISTIIIILFTINVCSMQYYGPLICHQCVIFFSCRSTRTFYLSPVCVSGCIVGLLSIINVCLMLYYVGLLCISSVCARLYCGPPIHHQCVSDIVLRGPSIYH